MENKCYVEKIYQGSKHNVEEIIKDNHLFNQNREKFFGNLIINEEELEEVFHTTPIFEVLISQNFPLEGCLLSLIKRRVMGYVFQTVKLQELKNE